MELRELTGTVNGKENRNYIYNRGSTVLFTYELDSGKPGTVYQELRVGSVGKSAYIKGFRSGVLVPLLCNRRTYGKHL